jgi:hypothetical protein
MAGETAARKRPGRPARDLSGLTFNMLTAVRRVPGSSPPKWLCQCACGNPVLAEVVSTSLTSGQVKSCGCLRVTWSALRSQQVSRLAANLASLNDIMAELTSVVSVDPGFTQMVHDLLKHHNWSLGYEWHGESAPAGWVPPWEKPDGEDAG